MLFAEGPIACPFVALENDRDRRSDEADHRHRCYAVPVPEPRAMAHQRAYCLTAQFTACPIFQDWAVRAAARPVPLRPVPGPLPMEEQERIGAWAAPPRWQHGPAELEPDRPAQLGAFDEEPADAEAAQAPDAEAEAPRASGGIPDYTPGPQPRSPDSGATSKAPDEIERLPSLPLDAPSAPLDEDELGASETAAPAQPPVETPAGPAPAPPAERLEAPTYRAVDHDVPPGQPDRPRSGRDPGFWTAERGTGERAPTGSGRSSVRQAREKAKPTLRREDVVPAWERARYEAYPTLGRRLDLGGGGRNWISRITTLFAILAILGIAVAAILLAPGLLGLGGPGASPTPPVAVGSPTPSGESPSPSSTVSPSPTPLPHETWQTYVIQSGDSMCRIASRFGVSYAQLMGANPQISNPGFIRAGDTINIPPDEFVPPSPAPEATPLGNPCG